MQWIELQGKSDILKLYRINYGMPFPWEDIKPTDTVIMVDFSLQPYDEMYRLRDLLQENGTLIWIDHHKTALDFLPDLRVAGLREIGKAGCELAWKYFFPNEPAPYVVGLVGRFDVWDHKSLYSWNDEIVPMGSFISFEKMDPAKEGVPQKWFKFFKMNKEEHAGNIEKGSFIMEVNSRRDHSYCKSRKHEGILTTPVGKLKVITVNGGITHSLTLEEFFEPSKHEAIMIYTRVPSGNICVSLYVPSDLGLTTNVGAHAKSLGGGGHMYAARFEVPYETFGEIFHISQ
jgi:hypothetical protein